MNTNEWTNGINLLFSFTTIEATHGTDDIQFNYKGIDYRFVELVDLVEFVINFEE